MSLVRRLLLLFLGVVWAALAVGLGHAGSPSVDAVFDLLTELLLVAAGGGGRLRRPARRGGAGRGARRGGARARRQA